MYCAVLQYLAYVLLQLQVRKDVFIELILPYSMVLGEELELPVVASNYLLSDTMCMIAIRSR